MGFIRSVSQSDHCMSEEIWACCTVLREPRVLSSYTSIHRPRARGCRSRERLCRVPVRGEFPEVGRDVGFALEAHPEEGIAEEGTVRLRCGGSRGSCGWETDRSAGSGTPADGRG